MVKKVLVLDCVELHIFLLVIIFFRFYFLYIVVNVNKLKTQACKLHNIKYLEEAEKFIYFVKENNLEEVKSPYKQCDQ